MNIIDVGTTTVKLFDENLRKIFTVENRQKEFGADVMTRVEKVINENKKERLSTLLKESVQELIKSSDAQGKSLMIGNAIMHHLYYGLSLEGFRKMPFNLSNETVSKEFPYFMPPLSPFIGSDAYPMILRLLDMKEDNIMAIDLGTNCEMVLKKGNRIFAASAPAGPAFDRICPKGSRIIVDIDIKGSMIPLFDREHGETDCILPSAFLKLISFLVYTGQIEKNGKLNRIIKLGNFVLDQSSIRELQKAKAAVSSLWKTLIRYYTGDNIPEKVIICGNLINNIDIHLLRELEIVPDAKEIILFEGRLEYFLRKVNQSDPDRIFDNIKGKVLTIPHFNMPDFENCYLNNLNFR